jgi:hypothetical protein
MARVAKAAKPAADATTPRTSTDDIPPFVATSAKPVPGDHVTLYTLPEAAVHLRMSEATIRRLERTGEAPRELFTWLAGRVYMTGDQIVRLIAHGMTTIAGPPRAKRIPKAARARSPRPRKAA